MPRLSQILLFLALCLTVAPLPLLAQKSSPLFTAKGIKVDVSGETAVSAKNRAFLAGGRIGLNVVVRRLSLSGRLPKLKTAEIENLIQNYLVDSEKSSAIRYIGALSYEFDADAVRGLMRKHSIVFTETRSQPVLVLPVWQTAAGANLFRGDNPWKQAWDRANLDNGSLLPIVTALGDLQDAGLINAVAAKAAQAANLKAIGDKYETAKVLVAIASSGGNDSIKLSAKLYAGSGQTEESVNLTVSGAGLTGALANAVRTLHGRLLTNWKNRTRTAATDSRDLGVIRTVFRLRNLQQWVRLQTAIENNPVVKSYNVLGLSKTRAVLAIRYAGNVNNLRVALRQNNILLKLNDSENFWWLYFRGDGAPPPSSSGANKTPGSGTSETKKTSKTPG